MNEMIEKYKKNMNIFFNKIENSLMLTRTRKYGSVEEQLRYCEQLLEESIKTNKEYIIEIMALKKFINDQSIKSDSLKLTDNDRKGILNNGLFIMDEKLGLLEIIRSNGRDFIQ